MVTIMVTRLLVAIALAAAVTVAGAGCASRGPAGPRTFDMVEYAIPWSNAFPSDVVVDSAGRLWFTDRIAQVIGRFDPERETFDSIHPPTPQSTPYGLIVAPDGGLWYGGSRAGLLGRIDPATGRIEEHHLAGAQGGPHQLAWVDGVIWFSLRESYRIGRYDTRTGETRLFAPFEPRLKPYSVAVGTAGRIWFNTLDSWSLIEVDRVGETIGVHALSEAPPPGTPWGRIVVRDDTGRRRTRILADSAEAAALPDSLRERVIVNRVRGAAKRMAGDPRGTLWIADWRQNRVVRYDTRTGEMTTFPSLGETQPYGLTVAPDGRVWFSEKGTESIVMLDPETGERARLALPTAGGVVRHIAIDEARGNIWLPMSDIGRIALLRLR